MSVRSSLRRVGKVWNYEEATNLIWSDVGPFHWSDIATFTSCMYLAIASPPIFEVCCMKYRYFLNSTQNFLAAILLDAVSVASTPSNMAAPAHDPIKDAQAQEATHSFTFRPAQTSDIPNLQKMIEESLRGLANKHYTQAELDGSIGFLFGPDSLLIHDQTYFILHPVDSPSTICACGGWSFRRTLYGADTAPGRMPEARDPNTERASIRAIFTHPDWARKGLGTMMMRYCETRARKGGFERLEMGSTLSGVALYEKCGYVKSGKEDVVKCPNGADIRVVHMIKDTATGTGDLR